MKGQWQHLQKDENEIGLRLHHQLGREDTGPAMLDQGTSSWWFPGGSEQFSGSKEPLPRKVTNGALHLKNKILSETQRKLFGAMILRWAKIQA